MIQDAFDDDFEYRVNCDGCGKQMKNPNDVKGTFVAHFDNVVKIVKSKGWTVEGCYCYCPKCAKALQEYGKDDGMPYMFAIDKFTYDGDEERTAIGEKLQQDGLRYLKKLGFDDADIDCGTLNVSEFAVPDLIKFYTSHGVLVQRDGSFFELDSDQ